jgi:tetratricopeptide (TPR) repeat protein
MALITRRTKDGNVQARQLLKRSLQLDPSFGPAHAAFAWSQAEDLFFGFDQHDITDCLDHARRAVALDDMDPLGHFALAWALTFDQQPELAIEEVKRAIEINPSYAHAHAILGRLLVHSGRCQEGIDHVQLAIRLAPADLNARQFLIVIAIGNFYLGNDAKAVELARQVIQTFDTWVPRMIVTAALGHLGDRAGAEQARMAVEQLRPDFSIEQVKRDYLVFDGASFERLAIGLRKAGVAER